MSANEVGHRPPEYLFTSAVRRRWVGARWAAVERFGAAVADDLVTRELPAGIIVREPAGELSLRTIGDLRALAADGSRRFGVVELSLTGCNVEVTAALTRRWYGARINVVCRSGRQAEALGLAQMVKARLGHRWSRVCNTSTRSPTALFHNDWFIGLTVMLIGLALTMFLVG